LIVTLKLEVVVSEAVLINFRPLALLLQVDRFRSEERFQSSLHTVIYTQHIVDYG